jgi:NADH:ubiquinone reductase (H+-translocating)
MTTHRILILGGGFGGVYAARRLDQIFAHRDDVEITLLSGENFLLFTPMLAEVVSSSIEASHIISPIRAFFRSIRFQNSE